MDLPKYATQHLFFSTSTRDAFRSPARKGWDMVPKPNFQAVLDPAKANKHVRSKAPGWSRDCCEYTTSFQTHKLQEQVAANAMARERVKYTQEFRDVRAIGRLASSADTTFRRSYPGHPAQPKLSQPQNPNHFKPVRGLPERSASVSHISGLVGNPDDWSPRTLRQIAICRTPGERPSTETRRRVAPMETTTNHMVEFAAEQYKKHVPDKITKAKPR